MTVDPAVVPGLLLLALELLALAAVGYVAARVALRQSDDRLALAQGLVIGLALWGLIVNFAMHLLPGLAGALAGWITVFGLGAGLAWHARGTSCSTTHARRLQPRRRRNLLDRPRQSTAAHHPGRSDPYTPHRHDPRRSLATYPVVEPRLSLRLSLRN